MLVTQKNSSTRGQELASVGMGDCPTGGTLPGLGLSEVQVVDAVQVHVLCVPGKGALPHAEVQVGRVHPFDLDAALALHRVQDGVQTPDVPLCHILWREGERETQRERAREREMRELNTEGRVIDLATIRERS